MPFDTLFQGEEHQPDDIAILKVRHPLPPSSLVRKQFCECVSWLQLRCQVAGLDRARKEKASVSDKMKKAKAKLTAKINKEGYTSKDPPGGGTVNEVVVFSFFKEGNYMASHQHFLPVGTWPHDGRAI